MFKLEISHNFGSSWESVPGEEFATYEDAVSRMNELASTTMATVSYETPEGTVDVVYNDYSKQFRVVQDA